MTRKSRADAVRNRQHIVTVARAAFADEGLDLPMREIARRACVGVATLDWSDSCWPAWPLASGERRCVPGLAA